MATHTNHFKFLRILYDGKRSKSVVDYTMNRHKTLALRIISNVTECHDWESKSVEINSHWVIKEYNDVYCLATDSNFPEIFHDEDKPCFETLPLSNEKSLILQRKKANQSTYMNS